MKHLQAGEIRLYTRLETAQKKARSVSTDPRVVVVQPMWCSKPMYAAVGDVLLYPDGSAEQLVYGRDGYTTWHELVAHYGESAVSILR
ncbi:MAG: hypothetical protein QXW98_07685 [Candidatus Caldarchaeum sp.]